MGLAPPPDIVTRGSVASSHARSLRQSRILWPEYLARPSGGTKACRAYARGACPDFRLRGTTGAPVSNPHRLRHRLPGMRRHARTSRADALRCKAGGARELRSRRRWCGRSRLRRRASAGQPGGRGRARSCRAASRDEVVGTASPAGSLRCRRAVGRIPEQPVAAAAPLVPPWRSIAALRIRLGSRSGLCPRPARTH